MSENLPKLVMARPLFPVAMEKLSRHAELMVWEEDRPMPRPLLLEWLRDAHGLMSAGAKVDGELLDAAPHLRVVCQPSVGYDNVDLTALTARGIPFGNTSGALDETVADTTFGLLLMAARKMHEAWDWVRSGKWNEQGDMPFGIDPWGKTLGIVGLGGIGAALTRRAQVFGMRVIYHNRRRREDEAKLGAEYRGFDALLAEADFVVALVPLTPATVRLFGQEQFAMMKPDAIFINAGRGKLVDQAALVRALRTGQIAYAALDVTDPEPLTPDDPLVRLPNVLIFPHIGSATLETRTRMNLVAADNAIAGIYRKPLPVCVNKEVNYR